MNSCKVLTIIGVHVCAMKKPDPYHCKTFQMITLLLTCVYRVD